MPIKFSSLETIPFEQSNKIVGLYQDSQGNQKNCIIESNDISTTINTIFVQIINSIYPVGSIYLSVNSTNPFESLGIGQWELIANDKVLQGSSSTQSAGSTIDAGLPSVDHTHNISISSNGLHTHNRGSLNITGSLDSLSGLEVSNASGAFKITETGTLGDEHEHTYKKYRLDFDASLGWQGSLSQSGQHTHNAVCDQMNSVNPIYGKSNTVQPNAFIVNVWKRIS